MKLTIIGATGSIGRHLLDQALEAGHDVTVAVRDVSRLHTRDPRVRVVLADATDADALRQAVAGADAVAVVLGAGAKGRIREAGNRAVIAAMRQAGVTRLVSLSTLGAGDSRDSLNFTWKYLMFGGLLRAAYADHQGQERAVRESGLDWTLVRPASFTDEPGTGRYAAGFGPGEPVRLKIPRADVAHYVLRAASGDAPVGAAVSLSA